MLRFRGNRFGSYTLNMESCDLNDVMRAIGTLEGKLQEGFEGIHRRQDTTNGRLDKHDDRLGDLEGWKNQQVGRITVIGATVGVIFGLIGAFIQSKFL